MSNTNDVEFEIKVVSIRTATVGALTDVVKEVEFVVNGSKGGAWFQLPKTVYLADPDPAEFIQLQDLTQDIVLGWITSAYQDLESIKAHIAAVVEREYQKMSLQHKPLPWVPQQPSTPVNNE